MYVLQHRAEAKRERGRERECMPSDIGKNRQNQTRLKMKVDTLFKKQLSHGSHITSIISHSNYVASIATVLIRICDATRLPSDTKQKLSLRKSLRLN